MFRKRTGGDKKKQQQPEEEKEEREEVEEEEAGVSTKYQYHFRILFVGGKCSGTKTSFIRKYTGTEGRPAYKELSLRGNKILAELYDRTCEDPNNLDAIVVGYDITDKVSYNTAIRDYRSYLDMNKSAIKMVIGNKLDLSSERQVSQREGLILADVVDTTLFYEGNNSFLLILAFNYYYYY